MARAKYSRKVSAVELSSALKEILDEYGDAVYTVLGDCVKEVREEAVEKLRETSPGTGRYAGSWTASELGAARMTTRSVVHNAQHYRLTHLLEKGHVSRNGTGRTFGRVKAYPHIGAVDDWVVQELPRLVKERLGR